MAYYQIPPDINEKEKVIGGVLTVSQLVAIIVFAVLGGVTALIIFRAANKPILALIVGIIILIPGLILGFKKERRLGDMEEFEYLMIKHRFKKQRKQYPNINQGYMAALDNKEEMK